MTRYTSSDLSLQDYRALAEFRHQLRRFLHFSAEAAKAAGIEPNQHQLLLALKGLPDGHRPTIGELAERLQVRHHSAVELVSRAETAGWVARERDEADRRGVLVRLTPQGEQLLHDLTRRHREELRVLGPQLIQTLDAILHDSPPGAI